MFEIEKNHLSSQEVCKKLTWRFAILSSKQLNLEPTAVTFSDIDENKCNDDDMWCIEWRGDMCGDPMYYIVFKKSDVEEMVLKGGVFIGESAIGSGVTYEINVNKPNPNIFEPEQEDETLVGKMVRVEWYGSVLLQGWQNARRISCYPSFCTTIGRVIEATNLAIMVETTTDEGPFNGGNNLYSPIIIPRGAIAEIAKLEFKKTLLQNNF